MDHHTMARKRAELDAIKKEIEADLAQRILREPSIRMAREAQRLRLERELAAAADEEYADELPLDAVIGIEWHLISSSEGTVLLCGDVGETSSMLFHFEHTEEFRLSELNDDVDINPLREKGLGVCGLFVVRNSGWKREVLATMSKNLPHYDETWWSRLEHFIVRGKGGELSCLARRVEHRAVHERIELLREKTTFWRGLLRPSSR